MNGNTFAKIFAGKKTHLHQYCSQTFLLFCYIGSSEKSIKKSKTSGDETDIFMSFHVGCKYEVLQNVPSTSIYESTSQQ